MRIRARYRLAATALCAALCTADLLALSGCAPSPPIAPESASPTADAPAFASDAEALEAARTAYAAFAAMSTSVGHDGGKSPERMADVAAGDALTYELHSLQDLANRAVKGTGEFSFDSMTLQSADLKSGTVVTYICLDVSRADVVDASGSSTLPPDRPTRYPLEVTFSLDASKDRLLVTKSDSWPGTNFC
ncbi:hypothetical protein E3O44_18345 [Cryobacterium algoricola]|uniref:Lipoprotein n=1 Tax=Cryobacterium algoricola TaxID=1259183 RepID=A0ABY2I8L2_9MICO|nr:hypothetical protein [Cryobacterium algoricola]TFB83804.1 hypothetical protein E3O44_18345 [Cryobacterium algoricola]